MSNDSTTFKTCNACHLSFPATSEYWHKNKIEKDGFCRTCKECAKYRARKWGADNVDRVSDHAKQYYIDHREHIKSSTKSYRDSHPDKLKAYFVKYHQDHREARNASNKKRSAALSPEQKREDSRRWIAANPDKRRAIGRKYGKSTKGHTSRLRRRARERSLPDTFTVEELQECLRWWGNACTYCGATENLTMDHFIPLVDPDCPGTVALNMLPACKSCNSSKSDSEAVAWLSSRVPELQMHEILSRVGAYFCI